LGHFLNPKPTQPKKNEHFISRIAVFSEQKGRKKPLMNTWDTEKAKVYLLERKKLNADVKAQRLKDFHKDINKKEISVACNECHSPESILDFKKLGFGEKKTKDLVYLNLKGLVTKYKIFYFPNLFGQ